MNCRKIKGVNSYLTNQWKTVRRALFKYSARGISGRVVEFPKGIDQQNAQNVTRPPSRRRTSVHAWSFCATCSARPKQRTGEITGIPSSTRPRTLGSIRSTWPTLAGPRSTSYCFSGALLRYWMETWTRTASACLAMSRTWVLSLKLNSSNQGAELPTALAGRPARSPLSIPRSRSFVARALLRKAHSIATGHPWR